MNITLTNGITTISYQTDGTITIVIAPCAAPCAPVARKNDYRLFVGERLIVIESDSVCVTFTSRQAAMLQQLVSARDNDELSTPESLFKHIYPREKFDRHYHGRPMGRLNGLARNINDKMNKAFGKLLPQYAGVKWVSFNSSTQTFQLTAEVGWTFESMGE